MANPKGVDWTAVERLFHEAVERPRAERGAFLASACGGDEALRREVEFLLARDDEPALDEPALDLAAREIAAREQAARAGAGHGPPSLVGRRLRGYEVLSLLGAGGMGEVYRARDTTLGRDVALKLLPRELSSDPERLRRLEREARVLASIEHPSIATCPRVDTTRSDRPKARRSTRWSLWPGSWSRSRTRGAIWSARTVPTRAPPAANARRPPPRPSPSPPTSQPRMQPYRPGHTAPPSGADGRS